VLAVVFNVPPTTPVPGLLKFGGGAGALIGGGMKQVVLQFTAWELQVIMQLVVVEVRGVESPGVGATTLGVVVCAKAAPHAAVAATARMIAKALMTASPIAVSYHSNLPSVLEFVRFPAGTCRRADQSPSASHFPSGLHPHPAAFSNASRIRETASLSGSSGLSRK
jgi:hypothetical protein